MPETENTQGTVAAPSAAAPQAPAAADHGDSSGRLEKLERDNARLAAALAKREEAEAKAKARAEATEREGAAKRGEWERLYGESETKAKSLEEKLAAEAAKREGYERLLEERIESGIKSVEDPELRKSWKGALEGLTPDAKLRMLDALQATAGKSSTKPSTPKPGSAGRSRGVIDLRELSKNTPATRRALNELILSELKSKGT